MGIGEVKLRAISCELRVMLNRIVTAQECDATGDDKNY